MCWLFDYEFEQDITKASSFKQLSNRLFNVAEPSTHWLLAIAFIGGMWSWEVEILTTASVSRIFLDVCYCEVEILAATFWQLYYIEV